MLPAQPPIAPMLAKAAAGVPEGEGWLYEPKWDGFRAILFWDGSDCYLQSRDGKTLGRYFPELLAEIPPLLQAPAILDGEIVIVGERGLEFDVLQQRLHPAESRVRKLAAATPATFVAFDLLALEQRDLRARPFSERRAGLVSLLGGAPRPLVLTPATTEHATALEWFERFEGAGFDGVVAKRLDIPYLEGERAMIKVKHRRTADCVVAGFRWYKDETGLGVGSMLLGLYDDAGVLHHVGHTSTFTAAQRRELTELLAPFVSEDTAEGFGGGRTPGTPSRWSNGREAAWVRLRPELVCEVAFDQMQGGAGGHRFRHGSTFVRWRPDKTPEMCRYDQLASSVPPELWEVFGA
jgi:ATP-dependent DNA ligase